MWDILIAVAVLWFFLMTSYCMAYEPPLYYDPGFIVYCILVDLMVALDIALHFRVTILDIITGEEINNPNAIFWKRIKSVSFYVDIITVVPFEVIKRGDILIMIGLMKVYKINRL